MVDVNPQMAALPSLPLSFDVKILKSRRIAAVGCQNGHTQLSITGRSGYDTSVNLTRVRSGGPEPEYCVGRPRLCGQNIRDSHAE